MYRFRLGFGRKPKGGENGLVDLFGGPAAEGRAAMQENLQSADDGVSWILILGIADRTDGEAQGQALQPSCAMNFVSIICSTLV